MDNRLKKALIIQQKDEITGYHVYNKLSRMTKDKENAAILAAVARNEKEHYEILKKYTGRDVGPSRLLVLFLILASRLLGLTFTLKFMENSERKAEAAYSNIQEDVPEAVQILAEEDEHELKLINMLKEERLNYIGSIVLGLNDALVELTGALAGFTFAIQNSRTIALIGLITGIAATFSMAASEFLSQRQEEEEEGTNAFKSSLYTGIAYIVTVILLVTPYFLFKNPFINLALMMTIAILIILFFNFYISVAKDQPFKKRFFEMALISIGVAGLSFGIGWVVRTFFGLDI